MNLCAVQWMAHRCLKKQTMLNFTFFFNETAAIRFFAKIRPRQWLGLYGDQHHFSDPWELSNHVSETMFRRSVENISVPGRGICPFTASHRLAIRFFGMNDDAFRRDFLTMEAVHTPSKLSVSSSHVPGITTIICIYYVNSVARKDGP